MPVTLGLGRALPERKSRRAYRACARATQLSHQRYGKPRSPSRMRSGRPFDCALGTRRARSTRRPHRPAPAARYGRARAATCSRSEYHAHRRARIVRHRAQKPRAAPRPGRYPASTDVPSSAGGPSREALLLQLLEQRVHRAVEDHLEVPARITVLHQVPRPLELVACLAAHGELHLVTRLRKLLDARSCTLAPGRSREETSRRVGLHRSARSVRNRRRPLRQFADRRADVGLGRETRNDVLHLAQRLLGRCGHEGVDVCFCEHILERAQRFEMNVSLLNARKNHGEPPHERRSREPPMGRAARQSEATLDKYPHRRARPVNVQPTPLDLAEIREHLGKCAIASGPRDVERRQKRGGGERGEVHTSFLPSRFSSLWWPPSRANGLALASRTLRASQRAHAARSSRERAQFDNGATSRRELRIFCLAK